jgi:hypothetical protein
LRRRHLHPHDDRYFFDCDRIWHQEKPATNQIEFVIVKRPVLSILCLRGHGTLTIHLSSPVFCFPDGTIASVTRTMTYRERSRCSLGNKSTDIGPARSFDGERCAAGRMFCANSYDPSTERAHGFVIGASGEPSPSTDHTLDEFTESLIQTTANHSSPKVGLPWKAKRSGESAHASGLRVRSRASRSRR